MKSCELASEILNGNVVKPRSYHIYEGRGLVVSAGASRAYGAELTPDRAVEVCFKSGCIYLFVNVSWYPMDTDFF